MKQKNIIDLLVENELLFSKLYLKYSILFPETKDFWLELSREEISHSQWIKALNSSSDIITFKPDSYTFSIVEDLKSLVQEAINSKDALTLEEALEKTLDFEKTFIEKNYFDIFSENSAEAFKVMERVKNETKEHVYKVMEYAKLL